MALSQSYDWRYRNHTLSIGWSRNGGTGPAWLLLPALSTISSRQEWQPFIAASSQRKSTEAPQLISVDWPGFGESERSRLPYDAALLARLLTDIRRDCSPADCGLIAAGHAAGIALLAAERHGLAFREWVLVESPLLGPLLYRLNTTHSVLGWMSRRHVDVAGRGSQRKESRPVSPSLGSQELATPARSS